MTKAAVIVLADIETHGDLARVVNAMMTAKAFAEVGDYLELVFDGAGTQWPGFSLTPIIRAIASSNGSTTSSQERARSAPGPSTQKTGFVAPTYLSWRSTRVTPASDGSWRREGRCSRSNLPRFDALGRKPFLSAVDCPCEAVYLRWM